MAARTLDECVDGETRRAPQLTDTCRPASPRVARRPPARRHRSGRSSGRRRRFPIKRRSASGRRARPTSTRMGTTWSRRVASVADARRAAWNEVPMRALGNDRWTGHVRGRRSSADYEYTVEGWIDRLRNMAAGAVEEGRRRPGRRERAARGRRAALRAAGDRGRPDRSLRSSAAGSRPTRWPRTRDDDRVARIGARCSGAGATRWRRAPIAASATALRSHPDGAWSSASARDSAPGTRCSRARPAPIRHAARRSTKPRRCLPYIAVDGLRRALSAADPSDRPQLPQGPQQLARRRSPAIRAAPGRSAPRKAGHTAIEPGLGTLDDFDRFVDGGGSGTGSRSRSTSPSRRRPIIPT